MSRPAAGLVLGGRYLPRLKQVKSIRCIVHCAVAGPGCVVTSTGCWENCERNQLLLFFVGTLGHSDNCLVQQSRVTGVFILNYSYQCGMTKCHIIDSVRLPAQS